MSEILQDRPVIETETTILAPISDLKSGLAETSAGRPRPDELKKNGESSKPSVSLEDSLLQRVSTIKEGDNVLLRLPSDTVKAVVASKEG